MHGAGIADVIMRARIGCEALDAVGEVADLLAGPCCSSCGCSSAACSDVRYETIPLSRWCAGELVGELHLQAAGVRVDLVLVVRHAQRDVVAPAVRGSRGSCWSRTCSRRGARKPLRTDVLLVLQLDDAGRIPAAVAIVVGNLHRLLSRAALTGQAIGHAGDVRAAARSANPGSSTRSARSRRARATACCRDTCNNPATGSMLPAKKSGGFPCRPSLSMPRPSGPASSRLE